jgi:hypothetical protein
VKGEIRDDVANRAGVAAVIPAFPIPAMLAMTALLRIACYA